MPLVNVGLLARMLAMKPDASILRDLARAYRDAAARDVHDERRNLWRDHNSFRGRGRVPVHVRFGSWNAWCGEMFAEKKLSCQDPFFRAHELYLRLALLHDSFGDDYIMEPWLPLAAVARRHPEGRYGVKTGRIGTGMHGGAGKYDYPIRELDDLKKMRVPIYQVDAKRTAEDLAKLQDALDGILTIDLQPAPRGAVTGDLSTELGHLRGIENIMLDMSDNADWLHELVGFMSRGLLDVQQKAEDAGYITLSMGDNQAPCYCHELEDPKPNSGPRKRKDLWGFFAAQEFTLISPAMHEEFLIRHQMPLMQNFGLVAYGCCEDLTLKIDMLRKIPNLRRIAVTPWADVRKCAEQIGTDYIISWRPNPTDMICCGFDEKRIRRILRGGLLAAKGCHVEICLKDVESVEGDSGRLKRWVKIAKEVVQEMA